jgi:hypothetical protein
VPLHLHGVHQLLLRVKHELDAAVCTPAQLLDDEVLVDKHIALRRTAVANRRSAGQQHAMISFVSCADSVLGPATPGLEAWLLHALVLTSAAGSVRAATHSGLPAGCRPPAAGSP